MTKITTTPDGRRRAREAHLGVVAKKVSPFPKNGVDALGFGGRIQTSLVDRQP